MAAFDLRIQIGFGSQPQSDFGSISWTDVSSAVAGWSTERGEDQEDTFVASPGNASILLRNQDGTYDPANESSPYFAQFLPGTPLRIMVSNGQIISSVEVFRYVFFGYVKPEGGWQVAYGPDAMTGNLTVNTEDYLAILARKQTSMSQYVYDAQHAHDFLDPINQLYAEPFSRHVASKDLYTDITPS